MVQHAATHSPLEEPQVVLSGWQSAERKVLGPDEGVAIVTAIRIDTVAKAKGIAAVSGPGATSGHCAEINCWGYLASGCQQGRQLASWRPAMDAAAVGLGLSQTIRLLLGAAGGRCGSHAHPNK